MQFVIFVKITGYEIGKLREEYDSDFEPDSPVPLMLLVPLVSVIYRPPVTKFRPQLSLCLPSQSQTVD